MYLYNPCMKLRKNNDILFPENIEDKLAWIDVTVLQKCFNDANFKNSQLSYLFLNFH